MGGQLASLRMLRMMNTVSLSQNGLHQVLSSMPELEELALHAPRNQVSRPSCSSQRIMTVAVGRPERFAPIAQPTEAYLPFLSHVVGSQPRTDGTGL